MELQLYFNFYQISLSLSFFLVFGVVCIIGTIGFVTVRPAPKIIQTVSILSSVKSTFIVVQDLEMLLLWPLIASYGVNLVFVFGSFPAKIGNTLLSSICLTLFGVVHMLVSIFGSRAAKWAKGNFLLILSSTGMVTGIILTSIATDDTKWLYFIAGAALGAMEPGLLIQLFIIFGTEFPQKLTPVNSAFRFFSSVCMATMFFVSVAVPFSVMAIITIIVEIFGFGLVLLRTYRKKTKPDFIQVPTMESTEQLIQ